MYFFLASNWFHKNTVTIRLVALRIANALPNEARATIKIRDISNVRNFAIISLLTLLLSNVSVHVLDNIGNPKSFSGSVYTLLTVTTYNVVCGDITWLTYSVVGSGRSQGRGRNAEHQNTKWGLRNAKARMPNAGDQNAE